MEKAPGLFGGVPESRAAAGQSLLSRRARTMWRASSGRSVTMPTTSGRSSEPTMRTAAMLGTPADDRLTWPQTRAALLALFAGCLPDVGGNGRESVAPDRHDRSTQPR